MAFEVQLANTQLPIILERERFYLSEGRALIWVVWKPSVVNKAQLAQSMLDIVTAHNDNLFSLDEETIERSRREQVLTLRTHWWADGSAHNKLVSLSDLTYPADRLPYAVDKPRLWHDTFKKRWEAAAEPTGVPWREAKYLFSELIFELDLSVTDTELNLDYEINALLCILLSMERGRIIGSRQGRLIEMLHTFLTTERRMHLATIVEHALRKSGHGALLERDKTQQILRRAKAVSQARKPSVEAQIVRGLFPTWATPVQS